MWKHSILWCETLYMVYLLIFSVSYCRTYLLFFLKKNFLLQIDLVCWTYRETKRLNHVGFPSVKFTSHTSYNTFICSTRKIQKSMFLYPTSGYLHLSQKSYTFKLLPTTYYTTYEKNRSIIFPLGVLVRSRM